MSGSRLDRVPAPALVLAAIASVQIGSAFARTLFDDLGASGITFLRIFLAAVVLLVAVRPALRTWSAASWRAAALLGATMAAMNSAFYLSLRTVPLGVAVTVEFLGPLLLALVQTRRLLDVFWAVLAGGGVLLLGTGGGEGIDGAAGIPLSGLALALLAGLFWAAYILASAHVGQVLPGMQGLAVALAVGSVLLLPFSGDALVVFDRPSLLLPALVVALLSSVLIYGFELAALRRMETRVFGILMSAEPAAAAIAGLIVLGQRLGVREVAALLLVSLASAGVTLARRDDPAPAVPPA